MTNLQFDLPKDQSSIIKVVGVGGGGSNAVNHMYEQGIVGVNFVIGNTDSQALDISKVPNKIQLGPKLTQGLGAGSNPECGAQATEESIEDIREILSKNTKMVFVTAGMGGGTGTGGAPVVARVARELGILTVGIVTTPFSFEGKRKYNQALQGIERLKEQVDTILVISNDKIREMYGNARQSDAFNHANNILTMAAKSISEIITVPGYINVDFADVKYVMTSGGAAIMGSAIAEGNGRAMKAVQGALNSPLLNDNDVRGAKKILVNISSGLDEQVTIDEITEINEYIQEVAKDTDIIFGTCDDASLGSKLSVTIIATGFEATYRPAFLTPVNKVVRDLNEEVKAPEAKPAVKESQLNLINLEAEPVAKKPVRETPVVAATPTPPVEEKVTVNLEEEEPYTLFSMLDTKTEEVASENVVVFEFETAEVAETTVSEELIEQERLHEEVIVEETIVVEELPVVEETFVAEPMAEVQEDIIEVTTAPEAEAVAGEEKEEENFVVFNVKSYETAANEPVSKESLDRQLNDRKRILSQLSYRSMNKGNMNEMESTPAYLRKGVEVQNTMHSNNTDLSRYSIGEDTMNQRPEVKKNNSFLHDNVD
ncbi:MAG: cell division protein FtsZ [Bacteroidetes bacterium]|nr:cell division protein FtsZ [Bacteroidota bacterium]